MAEIRIQLEAFYDSKEYRIQRPEEIFNRHYSKP